MLEMQKNNFVIYALQEKRKKLEGSPAYTYIVEYKSVKVFAY